MDAGSFKETEEQNSGTQEPRHPKGEPKSNNGPLEYSPQPEQAAHICP